jgi:hypothetical protein
MRTTRGFDIDHHVVLVAIIPIVCPADPRAKTSCSKLTQARELVAPDCVTFGFDLTKRMVPFFSTIRSRKPSRIDARHQFNDRCYGVRITESKQVA